MLAGLLLTTPRAALAVGPGSTGGGNTVGDQLFDDYINEGTEKIPGTKIAQLAGPILDDLSQRVPRFAAQLKEGIDGIIWYWESKPLKQDGPCANDSAVVAPAKQVVRACQNLFDVRIDKGLSESEPVLLPALIIHELLVYQRLHHYQNTVTDDGLYAVSREIRNMNPQSRLRPAELIDLVRRAGFGDWSPKKPSPKPAVVSPKPQNSSHPVRHHPAPYNLEDNAGAI